MPNMPKQNTKQNCITGAPGRGEVKKSFLGLPNMEATHFKERLLSQTAAFLSTYIAVGVCTVVHIMSFQGLIL